MPWEPGLARYGNFPYYYRFNPVENRTKLLPRDFKADMPLLFERPQRAGEMLLLDVGCNTGDLTIAIHELASRQFPCDGCVTTVGVDLDAQLISIARQHNRYPEQVKFVCADVIVHGLDFLLDEYVHASFDVVFCFGVTMWIHLNHGDDGLREFLRRLACSCVYLVLEAQPWSCYGTAMRRQRRGTRCSGGSDCVAFPLFEQLGWRETVADDIDAYLQQHCGLRKVRTLGETEWHRQVVLYTTHHLDVG